MQRNRSGLSFYPKVRVNIVVSQPNGGLDGH